MCKHLLATRLADAIGVIDIQQEINDARLVDKLLSPHSSSYCTNSNYQEEAQNTSLDLV